MVAAPRASALSVPSWGYGRYPGVRASPGERGLDHRLYAILDIAGVADSDGGQAALVAEDDPCGRIDEMHGGEAGLSAGPTRAHDE